MIREPRKDIVYNQELPRIIEESREECAGAIIKQRFIEVRHKDINTAFRILNKVKEGRK